MTNFIYARIAKDGETPTKTINGVEYVGVELPKLPEWDKETYPYAVIVEKFKLILITGTPGKIIWYELSVLDKEIQAISADICGAFDTMYTKCKCTDGVWGDFEEPKHSDSLGLSANFDDVVWTYKPIYWSDSDGNATTTLWMDAIAPVPVIQRNLSAMLLGFQVGQAIRRMRGQKKPVAYLYNGVRLPELPEWDKEQYPYAWIEHLGLYSGYLFVSQTPLYATGNTFNNYLGDLGHEVKNDSAYDAYRIKFPNPDWEDQSQIWEKATHDTWSEFTASLPCDPVKGAYVEYLGLNMYTVFWANHNVSSEDGTIYMAASEPVPVYE